MSGGSQSGDTFADGYEGVTKALDHAAACFYVPNAYNVFLGNAASGGWYIHQKKNNFFSRFIIKIY